MSDEPQPASLRRILVAADGSPHSQAALDAAVRLAALFGAEVEGLFVKDERLQKAAQLPFTAEVRTHSQPPRTLSGERIQRQLRRQAEQAEAALRQAAEQADVSYEFRAVEGSVAKVLLEAASEADLTAIGRTSTDSSRQRLGSTAESVLSSPPAPVLVLRRTVPAHHPVLVYYDGSDAAARALRLAAQLSSRAEASPLRVLLPARDADDTGRLQNAVQALCADLDCDPTVRCLTPTELRRLAVFARRSSGGLVVMPAGGGPLADTPVQRFLADLDRPLLLVR